MSKTQFGIIIFTFACFLFWFSIDLIRTKSSVSVSPDLQQALQQINPNFDQATLNLINNIQPLPSATNRPAATPTPSVSPTPTAKPTPTPIPLPKIASPSASVNPVPWEYQPY